MAPTSKEKDKKSTEDHELQDINAKMKMASNIVKACKMESQSGTSLRDTSPPIPTTAAYTKADIDLILKCKTNENPGKTFQSYEYRKKTKENTYFYDHIRQVYIDCLLEKRTIPTTQVFKSDRWVLLKVGFIYVRIPNTKYSMIIEKPDQAQKRVEYLSKVAQYRSEEREIYYVEEKSIGPRYIDGSYDMQETAKESTSWLSMCVVASKSGPVKLSYDNDAEDLYKTVIQDLAPLQTQPSVFILEEKAHHEKNQCPLPTPNSTKREMNEFLNKNGIPYDPEMSKAELYSLIEKSKNCCIVELYSLDETLKAYGHVVLRRPYLNGSEDLSFLKSFWQEHAGQILGRRRVILTSKNKISTAILKSDIGYWQKLEKELINREMKIYTEDLQVEEVIDKIMSVAKNEKLQLINLDTKVSKILDDVLILDEA